MRIATRVEFAFGADLTADPTTWTWTDVSSYALGSASVRFGRANEASTTQPATCELRLRNTDGRFTPRLPTSTYYPYVRRQTPVRVSLNPGGTGYVQRFQGYIDQFTPTWPSGRLSYSEVLITASGVLRRLSQGASPLRSALFRAVSQSAPVQYWPLEDGGDSTQSASAIIAGTPMIVSKGKVSFASASGLPSSAPVAEFSSGGIGGSLSGLVPPGTSTSSWRIEFVTRFNALTPASFIAAVQWFTTGSVALWEVDASQLVDGGLYLQYVNAAGTPGGPYVSNTRVDDDTWHHIRVDASQSGGNIALTVKLDGVTVITQTIAALTMGRITGVLVNPTTESTEQVPAIGHIAVWAPFSSSVDTVAAWRGYAGETAGARIVRLCAENSVAAAVSSTSETMPMGPQTVSTLLTLLRECEAADGGILYDGAASGISYLARPDRYNLSAVMALTASQLVLPFAPTEDDQQVRNDWTVSRSGGSSARYKDTTHIAANGLYDASTAVNNQSDSGLLDQAAWRVHLGTVDEMRVPGMSLQLINHSELWTSWLATGVGKRVTAVLPFTQYPPGTLDVIVEGYTENWDQAGWWVSLNTSPNAPWRVIVLATDTGDTGSFVGHPEPDDSALNAGISSTATSIAVKTNSGPLWTTTADDFPFDVNVGGEQIRVTAMAAVGPTFVAAGTAAHADNASVTPGLPAGAQTGDLLIVYAAIRSASGVVGTPTGYSALFAAGHVAAFYKLHTGTESAPVVSFTGGVAGDTTSAQVAALRGVTPTILFGPTAQANASAQNIAYPAMTYSGGPLVVLWFGWKQDDWTSVTNFETEIGEPSSTLGSDQGLVWNFSYQSLTTGLSGGSWVVTGGASAISESYVVALDARVQTATVTRSVNSVVKAHLVNAPVSLWAPLVLGL